MQQRRLDTAQSKSLTFALSSPRPGSSLSICCLSPVEEKVFLFFFHFFFFFALRHHTCPYLQPFLLIFEKGERITNKSKERDREKEGEGNVNNEVSEQS